MNQSIGLLDPTAPSQIQMQGERRQLTGLQGMVVGFIDNAKPNFNHLASDIADILVREHGVKSTAIHRKGAASIPASDQAIADIAKSCDLVITGSGD